MPLLNVLVHNSIWRAAGTGIRGSESEIRSNLCRILGAPGHACEILFVPCFGHQEQAKVTAELRILPKPDTTKEKIYAAALSVKESLSAACNAQVTVRSTLLDPSEYIAIR